MSRKTRKEKIAAAQKRNQARDPAVSSKVIAMPGGSIAIPVGPGIKPEYRFSSPSPEVASMSKSRAVDYAYVAVGLWKTVIFALLAIAAQFVLWYLETTHKIKF